MRENPRPTITVHASHSGEGVCPACGLNPLVAGALRAQNAALVKVLEEARDGLEAFNMAGAIPDTLARINAALAAARKG